MMTLLVGGARSGKSRYAQHLCGRAPVVYIATAVRDDDAEMLERIDRHRSARPASWTTIEEPLHIVDAVRAAPRDCAVVLDCATVWLSNLLSACRSQTLDEIEARVVDATNGFTALGAARELIVVSNDVGSGIVPANEVARRFRDLHGLMNQRLASAADRVVLMVAGIPVTIRESAEPIRIAAAAILDGAGRVLLVRKRNTRHFMQPGGKQIDGETAVDTLARELAEELGCRVAHAEWIGAFRAPAANEAQRTVEALLFHVEIAGAVSPRAEIEELVWLDLQQSSNLVLAPLTRDCVIPAVLERMKQMTDQFGAANPHAPAALSRFAFLIGRWNCEARIQSADGGSQTFQASWAGRFILDGYAIADEYRMTDASGQLIVLGLNVRAYDLDNGVWNMKWLHVPTGRWIDLGPPELGGVTFEDGSIVYAFREPMAGHAYTRATYTNISDAHFTWRGEKSDDGKAWREFMIVEAYRSR